jgi:hypothetical protein
MNCKPGDLAKIVGGSRLNGRMVYVDSAVLRDEILPSGYRASDGAVGHWLCEFLGGPVDGPLDIPGCRLVHRWWPIDDRYLRPIRDNDGEDETLSWAGKPREVETQ